MRTMTRNAANMKAGNMLEIIDMVRRGPVSRADVARAMGLTRAAVTIIVDRLVREGIITERGEGGGRKPVLLDIGEGGPLFMGVDITRVGCSIGISDLKGSLIARAGFGLDSGESFDRVLPQIVSGMKEVYEKAGSPQRLMGAGVSVPGPVDARTGTVLNPPNFNMLQNRNVLDHLKGHFSFGMWLDNNAAARALWEKNLGGGLRYRNFMALIVDTGVGSGLVLDGRLYRGLGFAGEAGHVSLDMAGPPCACGNRGCLEVYAAIPALLRRESAGRTDNTCWRDVVDCAEKGDGLCLEIVGKEARYLSHGIVNAANLLDLEAVILTGDVAYRPALLLDAIRKRVQAARITGSIHNLEIFASAMPGYAGEVCAAMIAMDRFFLGETQWGV